MKISEKKLMAKIQEIKCANKVDYNNRKQTPMRYTY